MNYNLKRAVKWLILIVCVCVCTVWTVLNRLCACQTWTSVPVLMVLNSCILQYNVSWQPYASLFSHIGLPPYYWLKISHDCLCCTRKTRLHLHLQMVVFNQSQSFRAEAWKYSRKKSNCQRQQIHQWGLLPTVDNLNLNMFCSVSF